MSDENKDYAPPGRHLAVCVSATEKQTERGETQWHLVFETLDGMNKVCHDRLTFGEKSIGIAFGKLVKMRVAQKGEKNVNHEASECLDAQVIINTCTKINSKTGKEFIDVDSSPGKGFFGYEYVAEDAPKENTQIDKSFGDDESQLPASGGAPF